MRRSAPPSALMRCLFAIVGCTLLLAATRAVADICKYADREGNLHYTNVAPEKGWKRLSCGLGGTAAPRAAEPRSAASPAGFPKVEAGTQKGRDDLRRKVLTEELATEEKLLAEAQTAYANGAPPATAEELAQPQRYADRIAKLRQAVSLHEKNIEALNKELAATH